MDAWLDLLKKFTEIIKSQSSDILFYRGHSSAVWELKPTLGRLPKSGRESKEQLAYFDFVTRAGTLLPEENSSWNNAFSMQHHGLPTRLLDWTESFGTALYFAVKDAKEDACVWMLDPFELNRAITGAALLFRPKDLEGNYEEYFMDKTKKLEGKVIATSPLRHNPRVFNQRAGFTVHDDLDTPLEVICSNALKKFVIPKKLLHEAQLFLKLIGVSEFSLFPDLDGLAREINTEHF